MAATNCVKKKKSGVGPPLTLSTKKILLLIQHLAVMTGGTSWKNISPKLVELLQAHG